MPDYEAGEAGYSITEDPYICGSEWAKRGKVRDNDDALWHARIMTYMAGAEGEVAARVCTGRRRRRQISN